MSNPTDAQVLALALPGGAGLRPACKYSAYRRRPLYASHAEWSVATAGLSSLTRFRIAQLAVSVTY